MKIIQIINRLNRGGGAEKLTYDLTVALSRIPDTELVVINIEEPRNNDFVDVLHEKNIRVIALSKRMYSIKNIFSLSSILKKENPDIVHVHLFPALYYVAFAKMLGKGRYKLLYTEHSTQNKRRNSQVFKIFDKYIYSKYDKIIAISDKVKSALFMHLGNEKNLLVINNGVDIESILQHPMAAIRRELNLSNECVIVTMVARFMKGKDYETVFKAMKLLPDNFHFLCVGNGKLLPDNEDYVKNLNLESRVHFLGLRTDVIGILKASDIVVLSTEHEGFSISMLEAMACKKPYVASSVPGVVDLVKDIAELFEYRNYNQLATILKHISNDSRFAESISKRCFDFACRYDITEISNKYYNLYK